MPRKLPTVMAAAMTASLSVFAAGSALSADLMYASGLPAGHPMNANGIAPLVDHLAPELDLELISGGQLFKLKEALHSVGAGIADMSMVLPAYHPSELPHAGLPFNLLLLTRNELAAAGATAETFYKDCPKCMEDYARSNTISLGNISIGGYSLMCRDEFKTVSDIKGKRVRVTGSLGRWAQHLGGVPVSMTATEMVESLQRGVLDCVMGFTAWYKTYAIQDSIKSIYNYNIGATGSVGIVTANLDSWNGLSDEKKHTLWDSMPFVISSAMVPGYIAQDIAARKLAVSNGIEIVDGAGEITPIWEEYKGSELTQVNENASKLGVENPEEIADAYLKNYAKWVGLINEAGLSEIHAGGDLLEADALEAARVVFEKLLKEHVYDQVDPTKL